MNIRGHVSVGGGDHAPEVVNPDGRHPVLLVCEHASSYIPASFDGLGLTAEQQGSHIAWDPGALATAKQMSRLLDAPLVHTNASRLLYDCNRPPEADDAMPQQSEATMIPGNLNLGEADRKARIDQFYRPFDRLLSDTLDRRKQASILINVHSFTPVYLGELREVEVGILHDTDARLAELLLNVAESFRVARNAPYGPQDGVTHTLRRHALPRGYLNAMIEVRNDLLATAADCARMAETLVGWIGACLTEAPHISPREVVK